jgi:hypothetical protein
MICRLLPRQIKALVAIAFVRRKKLATVSATVFLNIQSVVLL